MRNLILLAVLLVAGCDDNGPTEPIGTIGGAFDLTTPAGDIVFARISLNPYVLRYTFQRVTADGLSETRGDFNVSGATLTMTPDEGAPLTCDFDGYRVLRCGDGTYRMIP